MTQTLKVFIISLIAVFLLITGLFVYMAYLERENKKMNYNLYSDELENVEIPRAKVICIEGMAPVDGKSVTLAGNLNLHTNRDGKNEMRLNKHLVPMLETRLSGDTLFVGFKSEIADTLTKRVKPSIVANMIKKSRLNWIVIGGTEISLPVDSNSCISVVSKMKSMGAKIENVKLEELNVKLLEGGFVMKNNAIDRLTTEIVTVNNQIIPAWQFRANGNRIGVFNLGIAQLQKEQIVFSDNAIGRLSLMGNIGDPYRALPYLDCDTLSWSPADKGSMLYMNISDSICLVKAR